jgi:hypothetical protein
MNVRILGAAVCLTVCVNVTAGYNSDTIKTIWNEFGNGDNIK